MRVYTTDACGVRSLGGTTPQPDPSTTLTVIIIRSSMAQRLARYLRIRKGGVGEVILVSWMLPKL